MDEMPSSLKKDKSILFSFFNIISMQYGSIEFIAPLRQAPNRNYIIKGDVETVGVAGEDTPIYIAKYFNKSRTNNIPIPQKNKDGYTIDFINIMSSKDLFRDKLQKWMDYFEIGNLSIQNTKTGLLSLCIDNHNITDVGFGVSQVLPIIAQGLNMNPDSILLLEQPEIHLHPQMQMADFLLALACSNINVVVETHSDHVINRIIKRMMEDRTGGLKSKVVIYVVENDTTSRVSEILTDNVQGVINAPIQFFGQYGVEISEITRLGYQNLMTQRMERIDS